MNMLQAFVIPVQNMGSAPTGHLAVTPFNRTHPTEGRLGRALSLAVHPLENGQVALSHPNVAFRAFGNTQVLAIPQRNARIADIMRTLAEQGIVEMISISEAEVGLPVGPRTYDIPGVSGARFFQCLEYGGMLAVEADEAALTVLLELERAGLATVRRQNRGTMDWWTIKGKRGTHFGNNGDGTVVFTTDNWKAHNIAAIQSLPKHAAIFHNHEALYVRTVW